MTERLEQLVSELVGESKANRELLNGIASRQAEIYQDMTSRLAAVEGDVAEHTGQFIGLSARIELLEKGTDKLEDRVTSSHDLSVEAMQAELLALKRDRARRDSEHTRLAKERSTWWARHWIHLASSGVVGLLVSYLMHLWETLKGKHP
jgi:predicted nuclease with TOPRIM domain